MDGILTWMRDSALAVMIVNNIWVFPTLETLHFIGLILLMGSLLVIDLRFMGFAPRIPLHAVLGFLPLSLLGFVINLTTGILFLFSDPYHYYDNLSFRLKMLAVLLAGLNAIWFKLSLNLESLLAQSPGNPGVRIRLIAGLSLLLWTSVIVFGRMIPYLK
jgi:hypothetical protein